MLVKRRIGGSKLIAEIQRECMGIGVVDKENAEVGLENLLGEEIEINEGGGQRRMTLEAKGLRRKQLLAQQQGLREARRLFSNMRMNNNVK